MYSTSPIHRLDHDILLTILRINADMFQHDCALWDTRHASQVCHRWREIALGSPSLWSSLMDFDRFLWQKTDSWAKEVLRRAGSASLWVSTTGAAPFPKHTRDFFFHVLDNCWEQIEILKICMNGENTKPEQWDALYRCAPRLQDLDVAVYGFNEINKSRNIPLFQDYAPCLLRFTFKDYNFGFQTPWLTNLLFIAFEARFTLHELLNAIKMMTQLEYLRIDRIENRHAAIDLDENIPIAHLSKLNKIRILVSDLHASSLFIQHLDVPSSCSLFFGCSSISEPKTSRKLRSNELLNL